MTEQTLEKAIEIKRELERLRERKEEVKKVQFWIGQHGAKFKIQAQMSGCFKDGIIIRENDVKLVLKNEIEYVEKGIEELLQELSDLS